jgi:hypothetical protein
LLGAGGASLGPLSVASHAGDHGKDGLASRDPKRAAELGREPPRLLACGNGDVPLAEKRRDDAVKNEHPRQVAQPPVPPGALGRGCEQRTGDVKRPEDERRRPQVSH